MQLKEKVVMEKGQVSLEVILAVAILMITLATVYGIVSIRNTQTLEFEKFYRNESQCSRIALSISNVYSNGPRSRLLFEIDNDIWVGDNNVTVWANSEVAAYCEFPAKAQPAELSAGTVEAKNIAGVVVLSNA